MPKKEEEKTEEKRKFNVTLTEEELKDKIIKLQESRDLKLFLRVDSGRRDYEELQQYIELLEKADEKKE